MKELKEVIGYTWQFLVDEPTPPGVTAPQPPTTPKSIEEIRKLFGKAWQFLVDEPQPVNPATGPGTGPTAGSTTGPSNPNTGPSTGPSNPNTGPSAGPTNPNTGPSNPNTGPATAPTWAPENLNEMTSEYKLAWQIAEARWATISNSLPTTNTFAADLVRFRTGMRLLQENITGSAPHQPGSDRQVLMDYMLTRIWQTPETMRDFLTDTSFNVIPSGNINAGRQPEAQNLQDLSKIARAFFITPTLENVTMPNTTQQKDLRKLQRNYLFAFHPDRNRRNPNVNNLYSISINMANSADHLSKALSTSWDTLSHLITV